jgi:hypothetical protein
VVATEGGGQYNRGKTQAGGGTMGIRFFCPNGHKLNVKEFQAGRRGVCPHCQAKFQIPHESTRPSSKEDAKMSQDAAVAVEMVPEPGTAQPTVGGVIPSLPPLGTASAAMADPLAEGSDVVWYVRPASGGQFGPATPDVMRGWLAEKRIGADSLVWREGWRDWQTAADVFPQFSSSQPIGESVGGLSLDSVAASASVAPISLAVEPLHAPPMPAKPRWRTRKVQFIAIGTLAALVVVLAIVFLVVVLNR